MRPTTLLFGFAIAAITSCALDSSGLLPDGASSTTNETGGASASSSSTSSGTSGTMSSSSSTSSGTGGAKPIGDAVPAGAVSFFGGTSCPMGWDAYDAADGRMLLPALDPATTGTAHGTPLASGEDRTHTHAIDTFFAISAFQFVDVGGPNSGVGSSDDAAFTTTSEPASTGLPYVQFLVCKKSAPPIKGTLPKGMHLFFESQSCPSGWAPAEGTAGRFLVGLPQGAPPDQPFGTDPLASTSTAAHDHSFSATLQTNAHGMGAFSGCCNGGFAKNDKYVTIANTDGAEPALPYLELLQCQKL
jgi:hypothetical protein